MKPPSSTQEPALLFKPQRLELAAVTADDLPLLEQFVRAYYLEDGHAFREDRQPAALAALVAEEPLGRGWLIRLGARPVGYVVLSLAFSVEAGGREACVDELYLIPEVRNQGLGSRALALVEDEARDRGVRRIFLEVQRRNRVIGLYRRAGYVDQDRFLMSKFLSR
jgi:GNAT superfamily N-acetyltransferase